MSSLDSVIPFASIYDPHFKTAITTDLKLYVHDCSQGKFRFFFDKGA